MKRFLQMSFILVISISVHAQGTEVPWQLSWPFFENTSGPSGVLNGYGDWCVAMEGAHPGLDFGAVPGDSVLLPTDETCKVIWVASGLAGYAMIFGEKPTCTEGWGIAHLYIRNPSIYPFNGDSVVMNHRPCSGHLLSANRHERYSDTKNCNNQLRRMT